jgi:hypothetical protein
MYENDWRASDAAAREQGGVANQQSSLGSMLLDRANGNGPSVAVNQLRQGQAQNMAAMNSQAASASGGAMNRMMAQNAAINSGAQAGQQAAGQAATMRAGEQIAATGQLQGLYGQQRGQALEQEKMSQERQLGIGSLYAQQQAQNIGAQNANMQSHKGGILGGMAGIVGGLFSDVRMKQDISNASEDDMSALLDHLVPRKYRYKEESSSAPIRIGVMAQDIEGAPGGKALVGSDEDGMKYIQGPAALGTMLAALGDIHERINQLEGGRHHGR